MDDNRRKRIYDALLQTLTDPNGAGSAMEAKLWDGYGSEWLTVDGDLDLEHLTSDIIRWVDSGLAADD